MEDKDNVVDLDTYRNRRIADGTWPPSDEEARRYWNDVRNSRRRGRTEHKHVPFEKLQPREKSRGGRDPHDRLMDEMIRREENENKKDDE